MIAVSSADNIFSYKMKYLSYICYQKVNRTNINEISIIMENPTFGYFSKKYERMSSENLDFPMY